MRIAVKGSTNMPDTAAAAAAAAAQAHAQAVTDSVTTVAQAATYGGAAGAVVASGLSLSQWAAIVSMTVAVLGFALQVYMASRKVRQDRFITPPK